MPHRLLLNSLALIGISENLINWVAAYLSRRDESVVLNGRNSLCLLVTSGVQEGGVLRPLVFLIFINEICEGIQSNMKLLRMIAHYTELQKMTQTSA